MAITSIGYPGTVAPGEDWADLQRTLGKHLAVDDPHAFRVMASPTGTRQLKVTGPGRAMGEGILDHLDATVEMPSLPSVPSGHKYFLIVLNRHWDDDAGGFRSELGYVEGTAARTLPAYTKIPGVLSQQPLALVRITAGNTVPTEIVDLRVVSTDGAGGNTVFDDLALANGLGGNTGSIVRNATTGRMFMVSCNVERGRVLFPFANPQGNVKTFDGGSVQQMHGSIPPVQWHVRRIPVGPYNADGAIVFVSAMFMLHGMHSGGWGGISAGSTGGIADVNIGRIVGGPSSFAPEYETPFLWHYVQPGGSGNGTGHGLLLTSGDLVLTDMMPNTSVRLASGQNDIKLSFSYYTATANLTTMGAWLGY